MDIFKEKMKSILFNQRGTRFTIWQMVVFGAICALIGMVVSSYASTQYLYPTDCNAIDEQSIDDGDSTYNDLTGSAINCTTANLVGTGYNIIRVELIVTARRSSGTPTLNMGVYNGSSTNTCSRYQGRTDYVQFGCMWEQSPFTSSDWTISEVNSLYISLAETADNVRVTQAFLVVETDEHESVHTGVLKTISYDSYGRGAASNEQHNFYSFTDTDSDDPANSGTAFWLAEREGSIQDEGHYLFSFSTSSACHASANGYWAGVFRYQPGGDRYEVWVSCDVTTDVATVQLKRFNSGSATTLVSATEVTGSDINPRFNLLTKVSGVTSPTFTVDIITDTAIYNNVFTYQDTSGSAINTSGRWGVYIDESTSNYYFGIGYWTSLSSMSSLGIKVTNLPTGSSIRFRNQWGNVLSTVAESSGEAIIPIQTVQLTVSGQGSCSICGPYAWFHLLRGSIEVISSGGTVIAETGYTLTGYGTVLQYLASKKLNNYRLGAIEDSVTYSGNRRIYLWYQLDRLGTVSATCSPSCTVTTRTAHTKQSDYIGVLQLDNIPPVYQVNYSITVDGTEEGTGTFRSGVINTTDAIIQSCWSSCVDIMAGPHQISNTITSSGLCDFFVMEGDTPYTDAYASNPVYRYMAGAYKAYLNGDPHLRFMFQNNPMFFILNDHEACDNYSIGDENIDPRTGTTGQCSGWDIVSAKTAYNRYINLSNPTSPKTGKFWYSAKYGKTDNYFADQIFERTDPEIDDDYRYYYGQNPPSNPVLNKDWENGTTNWTCQDSGGGTCDLFDTVTSPVQNRSNALRIQEMGTSRYAIAQQAITILANTQYRFRVYYRQNTTGNSEGFRIKTDSYTAGSNICATSPPTTANVWTALDCIIPDTNTDTSVYVQMTSKVAMGSGDYSYYDNLTLEIGSEIQPSCSKDGTTLNYLNCSGQTFTSETTVFDAGTDGNAMVLFPNDSTGKYYQILSVVDADTLSLYKDEDENGTNDNIAVAGPSTTRIWKNWKNSHGADQAVWLFNKWRAATNPIQVFWSSYPLFGHRFFTGIYAWDSLENTNCAGGTCGFGYEHDLIISELQILSQSGSGKKVLLPVGDEHTVRLSKWSTYDIYEFLVSGMDRYEGGEWRIIGGQASKESRYSGLSIKADLGGMPNWGQLRYDTSSKGWKLTVYSETPGIQGTWDGSVNTMSNNAYYSAPRGLDNTNNAIRYPEWMYMTGGPHVVRDSSEYCWKIGTKYDDSNRTMIRRSGDTNCMDWLSASAYTYNLNTTSDVHYGGAAISINTDGDLIVAFMDTGYVGKLRKCMLTGSPPTISACYLLGDLSNAGFESCVSSQPTGWTKSGTDGDCRTTSARTGTYGLTPWNDAYYYQALPVINGESYNIGVYAKAYANPGDYPEFRVGTSIGGSEIYSASNQTTTWTLLSTTYVATFTGNIYVSLKGINVNAGTVAYFDDSYPAGNAIVDIENAYSTTTSNDNIHLVAKDFTFAGGVGMVTISDNLSHVSTAFQVNNDTDTTNAHFPKTVKINSSNDQMIMWFVGATGILSSRRCNVGADSLCQSGELQTRADILTDTLIAYQSSGIEFSDIASKVDGTAVITYITRASSSVDVRSQIKAIYYNGTSWGSPVTLSNITGLKLWYAKIFTGGDKYFIVAIDESTDAILMWESVDGTTWNIHPSDFEALNGKISIDIAQITPNSVAVTYLSLTDADNTLQTNDKSVWGQSVTQIWYYELGQWRKNVNQNINTINRFTN